MTDQLKNFLARIPNMPTSKLVQYLANTDLVAGTVGADPVSAATLETVLAANNALANELDRRVPVPKENQP
jgi:hypothetical protein